MEKGVPFWLNEWMSGICYEKIMKLHCFTNEEPPVYDDKFFEVQQMKEWLNNRYTKEYSPSCYNCLDKSMITWLNESCPGWFCVPHKLYPFWNEYHAVADEDDVIEKYDE